MIAASVWPWVSHIWQSTLCAAAACLLTLAFQKNRAALRYWLWFVASAKFLLPFSLLIGLGNRFAWRTSPAAAQMQWTYVFGEIGKPLAAMPRTVQAASSTGPLIASVLLAIWLCGFVIVLGRWSSRWFRIRAALRSATPLALALPVPVLSSPSRLEPGVFGLFRPTLLLPVGITQCLTPPQFHAVIEHEMCHVRRRDNLTSVIHMFVEAVFWFYPLVWWMGARMVDERERACDEDVLRSGVDPQTYAEGILGVCKLCLESPLVCVSGVTGSDLKKRIARILTPRRVSRLGIFGRAVLSGAAIAAVAGPLIFGLGSPKREAAASQDQNAAVAPKITNVSVKPESPANPAAFQKFRFGLMPDSTFTAEGFTLKALIKEAYGVESDQIFGGPDWLDSQKYDLEAKVDPPPYPPSAQKLSTDQMLHFNQQFIRPVLADRFKLAVHYEIRTIPVYVLAVAEAGSKLHAAIPGGTYPDGVKLLDGRSAPAGVPVMEMHPGELIGQGIPTQFLAHVLSGLLDRMVLDRTGLTGNYDLTLRWAHSPNQPMANSSEGATPPTSVPTADSSSPSILVDAVQDQLGLKLEPQAAPVNVIVIDHAEEPSQN